MYCNSSLLLDKKVVSGRVLEIPEKKEKYHNLGQSKATPYFENASKKRCIKIPKPKKKAYEALSGEPSKVNPR